MESLTFIFLPHSQDFPRRRLSASKLPKQKVCTQHKPMSSPHSHVKVESLTQQQISQREFSLQSTMEKLVLLRTSPKGQISARKPPLQWHSGKQGSTESSCGGYEQTERKGLESCNKSGHLNTGEIYMFILPLF